MKKVSTLFASIILLSSASVDAQISEKAVPLTRDANYINVQQYIPQVTVPYPSAKEDTNNVYLSAGLSPIGTAVTADISFPASGTVVTMDDGRKIWRSQFSIPGAPALGFYYDHFHLPKGVKYFLSNGNGKQLLGAYTAAANTDDQRWANEKVQGDIVNLEVDMDEDVDPSDIILHINKVAVFYGAIDYLQSYTSVNPLARTTGMYLVYGRSSSCEVNARCPQGVNFPTQRKATVHIEYALNNLFYAATGTLINNANQDCVPYLLTASHVDATNGTTDTTFSQWMFYFNYETPTCIYTDSQPSIAQTMTGALFKARSWHDTTSYKIIGDFLLLQLKQNIPASYDAYLAGWDRSNITPTSAISFHHPVGDVKKLSTATTITPDGTFNGGADSSHWQVAWAVGGMEEGSSGCGLFDENGRLIGDLSGGGVRQSSCHYLNYYRSQMSNYSEFSKLSLNWEYVHQQPSSATTRLKDWLDPNNTGVMHINAVPISCDTTTAVPNAPTIAANTITLYPNPASTTTYLNIVLDKPTDMKIELFNIVGTRELELIYPNAISGQYKIDLSKYHSGMYTLLVNAEHVIIEKKLVILK